MVENNITTIEFRLAESPRYTVAALLSTRNHNVNLLNFLIKLEKFIFRLFLLGGKGIPGYIEA